MTIKLLKSQLLQKQFRKELIFISWVFFIYIFFGTLNPHQIKTACQSSITRVL